MIKIDLITGFLGSGKTVFIKQYAEYLIKRGMRIGIIENDYGAVNVDMMLLQELEGDCCELEMIAGGCDPETHRRRFRTKLIAMGMMGYDRILVEPSGIYDVDEFFDTLRDAPLDQWYEAGNVITVVNASALRNHSGTEDYLYASEAAHAGILLLNRMNTGSDEERQLFLHDLNETMKRWKCSRCFLPEEILGIGKGKIREETFKKIVNCGYREASFQKLPIGEKSEFQSLYLLNESWKDTTPKDAAEQIFQDPSCGEIFRIKGFYEDADNGWMQLNASPDSVELQQVSRGQNVLILIGRNLNEARIREILA